MNIVDEALVPLPEPMGTTMDCRLDGLRSGQQYWFFVRAFDECGNAPRFETISTTTCRTHGICISTPDIVVYEDSPDLLLDRLSEIFCTCEEAEYDVGSGDPSIVQTSIIGYDDNRRVNLSFPPDAFGETEIYILADCDGVNFIDTIGVTVLPVNDPPVLTSGLPDSLWILAGGDTLEFNFTAEDPDGDDVEFS
jgi:hypothetical protein